MCAFGSYYYPHESLIILRNTIINKSTKEVFVFCSGCYGQAQYLSWVVHQTILRAFSRYLFPMKDTKVLSIFHVSSNIYKLWLLLCYLRVDFHQLASPPGFHVAHIPKGNLVLLYINVIFWHIGIFFSSGGGSFLVLSDPWHAGSPLGHHGASLGPGRGPWHVLWGFKVPSPHGEGFRACRASQAHANPRTG